MNINKKEMEKLRSSILFADEILKVRCINEKLKNRSK